MPSIRTLSVLVLSLTTVAATAHEFFDNSKVTPLMEQALAGMPGKRVTLLTVEYPPGGSTDAHRHPGANTFVYVLEGEIEMAVEGGEVVRLGPGQTFYETPTDVHQISRNPSDSKPARFLVVFVHEEGQPPLVPIPSH